MNTNNSTNITKTVPVPSTMVILRSTQVSSGYAVARADLSRCQNNGCVIINTDLWYSKPKTAEPGYLNIHFHHGFFRVLQIGVVELLGFHCLIQQHIVLFCIGFLCIELYWYIIYKFMNELRARERTKYLKTKLIYFEKLLSFWIKQIISVCVNISNTNL